MKLFVFGVCIALLSAAVLARDLSSIARKERERRRALAAQGRPSATFTNDDLDAYEDDRPPSSSVASAARAPGARPERDHAAERRYWRKERVRHDRELARLDLRIRKLEARLMEHRARHDSKIRALRDPSADFIEESLEALREEREELERRFQDRARREGALPGWLR